MSKFYFISTDPGRDNDAIALEIANKEDGEALANFLEFHYGVFSMVLEGENLDDAKAVYVADPNAEPPNE